MKGRFLLDSGIAQDFVQFVSPVFERAEEKLRQGASIGICPPVLGEFVGGFEQSRSKQRNLRNLRAALRRLLLWPFDKDAAYEYGRLVATLKQIGRPIPQIDIQVAAVALVIGKCTVVTKDTDFQTIPNLPVEDWSK